MTNKRDVCIIIPIHKDFMSDLEYISFQRIIHVFAKRKIQVIGPFHLEKYINKTCRIKTNIKASLFCDKYFKGMSGYNRLLMSSVFYSHFSDYEYILICQLDVFVLKDDLDYWLLQNKDNIGAPIFEGYTEPGLILKKGNNGGFCLRNTKSCIEVLSNIKMRYSKISSLWKMETNWIWKLFRVVRDGLIFNYKFDFLCPIINEDMFWSVIVPDMFPWFKICDPEEAKYFAFDANPHFLFKRCNYTYPMAIHAWWRYNKSFVVDMISEFKNLENDTIANI